jgi:hypothetical protein
MSVARRSYRLRINCQFAEVVQANSSSSAFASVRSRVSNERALPALFVFPNLIALAARHEQVAGFLKSHSIFPIA